MPILSFSYDYDNVTFLTIITINFVLLTSRSGYNQQKH